jgi:signal transduction histidine kinase
VNTLETFPRSIRRVPPFALDLALAAAVLIVGILDLTFWVRPSDIPPHFHVGFESYVLMTLSGGALALRRKKLWAGYSVWLLTEWGGLLVHSVAMYRYGATIIQVVWVFTLAEQCWIPVAAAGLAAECALDVVVAFALPHGGLDIFYAVFDVLGFFGLTWFAGRASRRRVLLVGQLQVQTAELSDEQRHLTQQAVAAERGRIAGELHPLVIQGIERMTSETRSARLALEADPMHAGEAIAVIEATGRRTLVEMGRLLSLMDASNEPDFSLVNATTGGAEG